VLSGCDQSERVTQPAGETTRKESKRAPASAEPPPTSGVPQSSEIETIGPPADRVRESKKVNDAKEVAKAREVAKAKSRTPGSPPPVQPAQKTPPPPEQLVWNVWAEPSEIRTFRPLTTLKPGQTYRFIVDLSGLSYTQAGVTATGASADFKKK